MASSINRTNGAAYVHPRGGVKKGRKKKTGVEMELSSRHMDYATLSRLLEKGRTESRHSRTGIPH